MSERKKVGVGLNLFEQYRTLGRIEFEKSTKKSIIVLVADSPLPSVLESDEISSSLRSDGLAFGNRGEANPLSFALADEDEASEKADGVAVLKKAKLFASMCADEKGRVVLNELREFMSSSEFDTLKKAIRNRDLVVAEVPQLEFVS